MQLFANRGNKISFKPTRQYLRGRGGEWITRPSHHAFWYGTAIQNFPQFVYWLLSVAFLIMKVRWHETSIFSLNKGKPTANYNAHTWYAERQRHQRQLVELGHGLKATAEEHAATILSRDAELVWAASALTHSESASQSRNSTFHKFTLFPISSIIFTTAMKAKNLSSYPYPTFVSYCSLGWRYFTLSFKKH